MSGETWIPRVGGEFAGYRLEGLVGHGGMSIVYRAHHLRLERTVALKLLMPELSGDESFRERFTRESRLAASLDHPNVIPIYEAGDQDGVFYIAMRYVDGSTLKELLQREGPLDPGRTASILGQVASALQAAHEQKGLVHRDVKPANILIVPGHGPEGGDHVYLSDFGIAKQRAAAALTKTGMFVGTADYAAPEQIEGKELDRRADVYAMGCVLYECLTGSPTYEKDSEVALMYAHLLEPPPVLTEKRPDLSPEIDDVVAKAMAKSRDDRYETAAEFSRAVRKALTGTETTMTRQAEQVAAPETVFTPSAPPPEAAEPAVPSAPAPPRARRAPRPLWLALGGAALAAIAGAVVAVVLLTGGGGTTAADTLLDVVVPTEIANACTTETGPRTVETETCSPPANAAASFPDNLQLSFYSSGEAVKAGYDAKKTESGVAADSGRCDRTLWRGEGIWHHASSGDVGGRRLCYLDANGAAVIVWTHEKLGSDNHVDMLAVASEPGRGSQTSLFAWWRPYHEVIGKCRARLAEQTCLDTIKKLTGK